MGEGEIDSKRVSTSTQRTSYTKKGGKWGESCLEKKERRPSARVQDGRESGKWGREGAGRKGKVLSVLSSCLAVRCLRVFFLFPGFQLLGACDRDEDLALLSRSARPRVGGRSDPWDRGRGPYHNGRGETRWSACWSSEMRAKSAGGGGEDEERREEENKGGQRSGSRRQEGAAVEGAKWDERRITREGRKEVRVEEERIDVCSVHQSTAS